MIFASLKLSVLFHFPSHDTPNRDFPRTVAAAYDGLTHWVGKGGGERETTDGVVSPS